mmetsp:Transcript_25600/g.52137  ORF Transcript_25600/g.52137 Transcript_25600/m.52137 type:complete len:82 (-) Transcript_25600:49-294(-)
MLRTGSTRTFRWLQVCRDLMVLFGFRRQMFQVPFSTTSMSLLTDAARDGLRRAGIHGLQAKPQVEEYLLPKTEQGQRMQRR